MRRDNLLLWRRIRPTDPGSGLEGQGLTGVRPGVGEGKRDMGGENQDLTGTRTTIRGRMLGRGTNAWERHDQSER